MEALGEIFGQRCCSGDNFRLFVNLTAGHLSLQTLLGNALISRLAEKPVRRTPAAEHLIKVVLNHVVKSATIAENAGANDRNCFHMS